MILWVGNMGWFQMDSILVFTEPIHIPAVSCLVGWVLAGVEQPQLGQFLSAPSGLLSSRKLALACSRGGWAGVQEVTWKHERSLGA